MLPTGLGSNVGLAPEGSYGVFATPTRFPQAESVGLKKVKNVAQGNGLGAGRLMRLGSKRVPTTKAGAGPLAFEVQNHNLGLLLQALMGTTVVPVQQGATPAYLQTHTLADNTGKSLTIQAGVPDTSGTVRAYTFLGCKVLDAEFTYEIANPILATFNIDAQDVSESQGLAAPSYPAGLRSFVGADMGTNGVKVGAFGAEAAVQGVTKVTCKIARPSNQNRFYFNNANLKKEPLQNDFVAITGSIEADYVDKTVFADRFVSDAGFSLVVAAQGQLISGAFFELFTITLPDCFLDGDTPMVGNADVVSGSFPFTCLYDGTNLPVITYQTTDTTL